DLKNVLVVAVHRVAGELVRRDVASKIERRHRKVGGDSWVGRSGGLAVVDGRGKRRIELAVLVDLADGGERPGDAVGAGERPEQTVEGPVLVVDDDEVIDHLDGTRGPRVALPSPASDDGPAEGGGGRGGTDPEEAAPRDVGHGAGL